MSAHVLEVAIFTLKPGFAGQIAQLRDGLRQTLSEFPGLIEYQGYTPLDDGSYADIAKWDSHASAQAVAQAFASGDARFAPYAEAIDTLQFMGHFASV